MKKNNTASKKFVFRNYWAGNSDWPYRAVIHDLQDQHLAKQEALNPLFKSLGIQDGDEFEIIIKKTGRRPFGDRRFILQEPHIYGPETDEQIKERLRDQG